MGLHAFLARRRESGNDYDIFFWHELDTLPSFRDFVWGC
jgi:hypothetical protein